MKKLCEEAAAIREKTGGTEMYKIAQMGNAVRNYKPIGQTAGGHLPIGFHIIVEARDSK